MSKNYPEIRIKDAWLLRDNASKHLHELWGKKGSKLADDKDMEKIVSDYQKSWRPLEDKVIKAMCDMYNLEFRQNVINVYIAPWFNAFSDPLVIGVTFKPDEFVDTLTHELFHRLFTDNTTLPYKSNILLKEWQELFGKNFDFSTLVHIPVHAGLKAVYIDTFKEPDRLNRDINHCKENEKSWGKPYVQAWDYVEQYGYKNINRKVRDSYKKLACK